MKVWLLWDTHSCDVIGVFVDETRARAVAASLIHDCWEVEEREVEGVPVAGGAP